MNLDNAPEVNILIVDDNPVNLKVLFNHLKRAGFRTLIAKDGFSAIKQANRLPPDLILLDVMMPGLDGFQTCRRLKKSEATKEIPVIFITALTDIADKVKGFEAGAVDYITKPFQQEEVLARINTHLTIQAQQRKLHKLNATKDKFFSIIAHDLKGAFGGLLGFSELLATAMQDFSPEQTSEIATEMNESLKNTFKLLENLLDWARLQKGMMKHKPELLDLYPCVEDTVKILSDTAKHKGISLTNTIEPGNFSMYGDSNLINTVLRNLITNALKFTHPGGSVTVSARLQDDLVAVSVTDTGIGMQDNILANLFKIEAKVKRTGTANERGTGLGLILCREMVEKQGGKIWATSEVGQGSTFTFTVPSWRNQN